MRQFGNWQKAKCSGCAQMRESHCVLIPGWATTGQIFDHMTLPFSTTEIVDYAQERTPAHIIAAVRAAYARHGGPVSILGFSMGGFLVAQCLPEIINYSDHVILVGIRQRYSSVEITQVREHLRASVPAFLKAFYKSAFPEQMWKSVLENYATHWDYASLDAALVHLGQLSLTPEMLSYPEKIVIVHGQNDRIAPLQEARQLSETSGCHFWVSNEGHFVSNLENITKNLEL